MNLSKAQHDVMEMIDSNNDRAKLKTDFVCALYVKMDVLENQHFNVKDIFTKFTGHPMNWTNMMSSKRADLCEKNLLIL